MPSRRLTQTSVEPDSAFLNIPFDKEYEPLFLAFIAGLSGFGLTPKTVLQIPGSHRRLDRLTRMISACQYSFHDLSRVELDHKRPRTPRFNMPFELGLAVAWTEHVNPDHRWYVFEAKSFRVLKSLSDINGTEVYVHQGRPTGVFRQLTNVLARSKHRPTVRELQAVYRELKHAAVEIKRKLATNTLFDTRAFLELAFMASVFAKRRIASLRDS